jgi:hypothetical protein
MRRWAIINTFLALIVLLLAIEIARTWARSLPSVEVAARTPARPAGADKRDKADRGKHAGAEKGGTRAEQAPAAMVLAIVEKDLFDPSRQKAVEELKAEVPKQIEPPKGVTVVGISIVGREREAFITDTSQPGTPGQVVPPGQAGQSGQGGQQRRLRIGDQIQGYTVRAVEQTGLTLVSPSGDVVPMTLEVVKSGSGGPAKPVPGGKPAGGPVPPAAGSLAASPAAGVGAPKPPGQPVRPPGVPVPPPGVPAPAAAAPGQPHPGMPGEVRERLQQLGERKGGAHSGRKRQ